MKKKLRVFIFVITIFALYMMMTIVVSADEEFGSGKPANVDTTSMDALVTIVFWAVRILIGAAGGIPSIIKIVQGQTDENPRDRNAGIAGLVATGVGVGATFALEAMF